jgi:predicted secreted protein
MAVHRLSQDATGTSRKVAVGDEIQIALSEMSGAGYQWELEDAVPSSLELLPEASAEAAATPGAANTRTLRLRVVAPGQATLKLAHKRAWESASSASKRFSLTVDAK